MLILNFLKTTKFRCRRVPTPFRKGLHACMSNFARKNAYQTNPSPNFEKKSLIRFIFAFQISWSPNFSNLPTPTATLGHLSASGYRDAPHQDSNTPPPPDAVLDSGAPVRMITPHQFQVTAPANMGYDSDSSGDLNLVVDIGFAASDSDLEEADRIMSMIQQDHVNHLTTPNNSPTATSPASTPLQDHINHQFQLDQIQLQLDRDAALAGAMSRNLDPLNTHESPNTSFDLDTDQSFIYVDESDNSLANNLSDASLPSLPEISWLPTPHHRLHPRLLRHHHFTRTSTIPLHTATLTGNNF